ncbi:MAG TPA: hypothetical protein HA224_03015 [Nanoarchaeota archaeon]|nr:hypothetical protein [Nanoarchaeota archaeon]
MKLLKLTEEDKKLIDAARNIITQNKIQNNKISCTVGAALISGNKTYKGINLQIETSAPTSICAEMAAIAQMVSSGAKMIRIIVAVRANSKTRWDVFQPCGACRHIISQFGNPWVIISRTGKARLSELYPMPVK